MENVSPLRSSNQQSEMGKDVSVNAGKKKLVDTVKYSPEVSEIVQNNLTPLENDVTTEKAQESTRPTAMNANFMSRLVDNVTRRRWPGGSTRASQAPQQQAQQVVMPQRPLKPPSLQMRSAEQQRGQILQVELKQLSSVLSECADGTKRPQFAQKGELVAVRAGRNSKLNTKTEEALNYMVKTFEEAGLLALPASKSSVNLENLFTAFKGSRSVEKYAKKNQSFRDKLDRAEGAIISRNVPEPMAASMDKGVIVETVVRGTNPDLSLLLMRTHRNNSETKNLLADLGREMGKEGVQNPETLTNVLQFGMQYVANGESIPVSGPDRSSIRSDLLKLAQLGTTSEDKKLQTLGAALEEKINTLVPEEPSIRLVHPDVMLDRLNQANGGPIPPEMMHAAYEEVRKAAHIVGERKDLATGLNTARKGLQENQTKLQEASEETRGEIAEKISSFESQIRRLTSSIEELDNKYPAIEEKTSTLQTKIKEIESSSTFPKASLATMSSEELCTKTCQILDTTFARVSAGEMDNVAWSKPVRKHQEAPNLTDHIQAFNGVAAFATREILSADNPLDAAGKVIDAAHSALQNNNFYAAHGLLVGLESSYVQKLKDNVWGQLSDAQWDKFEDLQRTLTNDSNFKVERQRTDAGLLKGPVNPYLPLLLSDVTFTSDGNPDTRELTNSEGEPTGVVETNLRRNQLLGDIKDVVSLYQRSQPSQAKASPPDLGLMAAFGMSGLENPKDTEEALRAQLEIARKR